MAISKKIFYRLSLFTLYGFGLLGWLIIEFAFDYPFVSVLIGHISWYEQLAFGLAYGIVTGILAAYLVKRPFFRPAKGIFVKLARKLDLTYSDIIFFSLCAGIGEEIFFRAAIQPIIGIWPTAIIFVALHGYLNPRNWRLSIYGLYMVLVSAGFGYLFDFAGLLAAIAAHFVIDVILFGVLKNEGDKSILSNT